MSKNNTRKKGHLIKKKIIKNKKNIKLTKKVIIIL